MKIYILCKKQINPIKIRARRADSACTVKKQCSALKLLA